MKADRPMELELGKELETELLNEEREGLVRNFLFNSEGETTRMLEAGVSAGCFALESAMSGWAPGDGLVCTTHDCCRIYITTDTYE